MKNTEGRADGKKEEAITLGCIFRYEKSEAPTKETEANEQITRIIYKNMREKNGYVIIRNELVNEMLGKDEKNLFNSGRMVNCVGLVKTIKDT